MTNLLTQAWPEYVAGVAVLVTGWAGAQALKALRRRRRRRPPAELPQIPVQDAEMPQVSSPDRAGE
ncbi:hypothetical protein M8I34_32235 [Streptomyces sp. MCA2]|uniref:hypothetical protein n=1 Tax=Streptomyces TaxID=1883 RepID=UPI002021B20B|nr:hypothetical protein [Streptomyces sp. MCA2]MCL7496038.1 hypothetical protein [Streptomyces sp. MCA2]WSW57069.1 hypothetical protein OG962_37300 [Streptomyces platensis]